MKIVIAPDSFKGSLSAGELCAAICQGVLRAAPEAEVVEIPLADGGEGTLDNLVVATGGEKRMADVLDPLGRQRRAAYGVLGDGVTAVIEMAQASGLPLLAPHERDPLIASSYGTGQLIRHALDDGFRRFVVGLGGSATNDAGTGMLRALGAAFLDADGQPLPEGGAALSKLASIDVSGLDPRLAESQFLVACDVTNPLCGPDGASAVFGPQKGATPEMVAVLDEALGRFADVVRRQTGREIDRVPGAGAAGGTGAALVGFLGATIRPGIEIVMEAVDFARKLAGADLLITGEGKLDGQTLSGKVIAGVCREAARARVPVVALCGALELDGEQLDRLGIAAAFSLVPGPCSLETAMLHARQWASDRAEQIVCLLVRADKQEEKQ